jgi:SAM-dependent methyltransferase
VLDAGCGSGKGMIALRKAGFEDVHGCDLTDSGLIPEARGEFEFEHAVLWQDLYKQDVDFVDWVYCTDVLEHIPTALTMLVVARLLEVAERGVFLTVSMVPDVMGFWIGKPLHETVQPFLWWRDHIKTVGRIVEARDLLTAAAFLVVSND